MICAGVGEGNQGVLKNKNLKLTMCQGFGVIFIACVFMSWLFCVVSVSDFYAHMYVAVAFLFCVIYCLYE